MKRLWRKIIRGERGQALPIVLAVMIIGGLMIAPALNHISTSLNAGRMVEENVKGLYAAEAGVEDVLWLLTEGSVPLEGKQPLPVPENENINQMQVEVETEDKGTYALYYGELVEAQKHYDWLDVDMVQEEEEGAYKCTITATWSADPGTPSIKLKEIGMRLPIGYEYVEDSADDDDFEENLSTEEPDITQDWAGADMVNWVLPPPPPAVSEASPVQTQTFYITGEGEPEGDYACVGTRETPIGLLGEFTGTFYSITSTATRPEDVEPTATVVADVLVDETDDETDDEVYIVRWQINPE